MSDRVKFAIQRFTDLLGRFLFGTFALLGAAAFLALSVFLLQGKPVGLWPIVGRHVLMDVSFVVGVFLLLAALKFFTQSQWIDRWLEKHTLKAGVFIVGFAIAIMAFGIAKELVGF